MRRDHTALGQALGPCGADVILGQDIEQRRPRDARDQRGKEQRERDGGQGQAAQGVPDAARQRAERQAWRPHSQATEQGLSELADQIQSRAMLYQSGLPFRSQSQ